MSIKNKSLISVDDLSDKDLEVLFSRSRKLKALRQENKSFCEELECEEKKNLSAFLVFAEPSTRTRVSFEMACQTLGISPIVLSDMQSSSIAKGESVQETVRTLSSLDPSLIILRYKGSLFNFDDLGVPIVNAGFGSYEHPTQALIDAFTIEEALGSVEKKKVLILGDVLHSRVSNSNLKLLKRLGAEVAFCSPDSLFPKGETWKGIQHFVKVSEALKWADVVMCLRIQQERHDMSIGLSIAEYRDNYNLGISQLEMMRKSAIIMHPGPCVIGVEMSLQALKDERSRILTQVTNGLYVRAALLSHILDYRKKSGS